VRLSQLCDGAHIDPIGWLLGTNNNVTSTTVQYWEYKSTDLNGGTLDVSKRISSSRQLTDAEAALLAQSASSSRLGIRN